MSEFSDKYFKDVPLKPDYKDCSRCPIADKCNTQNSHTIKPVCLVSGADMSIDIKC